jgi:hypothetical protein
MRKVLSLLLFLLAGLIILSGIALAQSTALRPLPIAATGLPQILTAARTDQADLQQAGYVLSDLVTGDRRERSYTFRGPSGSSAILVDSEYAPLVSIGRELVFDITFSVKEGRSPTDMPAVTPRLVDEARNAVREAPAVVAGLGYLATAARSGVGPEALQAAVIDYVRRYRQPSTPMQEVCAGCGSQDGFGDQYDGGPDMHTPLDVGESGWKIAGTRHYLNGDSAFTVNVTAQIPRS